MQILNGILCDNMCISPLFPFGFGGIDEKFCVPLLLRMCMRFSFIFIFRFMIFVSTIMHSECMHPWAFDCAHVDELGFSCVRDLINSSREGIFQVALEANLTVWNVDMNTKNSGPILERMVRTICFSSFDLSTPQALSCDSKSLNFVKKSWILSKLFGSNVRSSTYIMCLLISSYFPKIPSKVVQASLGVLQEDI
jgi:hypothetical protein